MNNIFLILAIISLVAVLISLALGVLGMIRSSDFNEKYGNLFMRLRIISQVCVVIFLILFFVTR
ncbi:MAG: hypothetical protein CFH01_01977 [Alphaproteobacteria bacterium MarineAlpha2_Bin1]|nr:MAG: hypothetical protein CFH01_01977 [Alphaproteobacteria bacterium MarineAlpha2_Bin1]